MLVKVGSIVWPGGASASFVGVGFTPKVVFLLGSTGDSGSASPEAFHTELALSLGFGTGGGSVSAHNYNIQMNAGWGSLPTAPFAMCGALNGQIVGFNHLRTGEILQLYLVSLDADGFTLGRTFGAGTGYPIQYLALGGTDLQVSAEGSVTHTFSGSVETVTGLPFPPTGLFLSTGRDVGTGPGTSNTAGICGWCDSALRQGVAAWAYANFGLAPQPTVVSGAQHHGAFVVDLLPNGTVNAVGVVTSLTSDGFTIQWTGTPIAYKVTAFGGVRTRALTFTDGQAEVDAVTVAPEVAFVQSYGFVGGGGVQVQPTLRYSFGMGTPDGQIGHWMGDNSGVAAPSRSLRQLSLVDTALAADPTSATTGVVGAAARFSAFGDHTLDFVWDANDGVGREWLLFTLGGIPNPTPVGPSGCNGEFPVGTPSSAAGCGVPATFGT